MQLNTTFPPQCNVHIPINTKETRAFSLENLEGNFLFKAEIVYATKNSFIQRNYTIRANMQVEEIMEEVNSVNEVEMIIGNGN